LIYLSIRVYFFGSLQYSNPPARSFFEHVLTNRGLGLLPGNFDSSSQFERRLRFPVSHSLLENEVILSFLLLAGLVLLILWLSRSNRLIGFWALWFAINLAPTNSVIVLEDLIADRWLYLSSVGYAILMAYG